MVKMSDFFQYALKIDFFKCLIFRPFRSKKAGRFEKLLGFSRSHFIVTRSSVSLSYATTPHLSCFSKS